MAGPAAGSPAWRRICSPALLTLWFHQPVGGKGDAADMQLRAVIKSFAGISEASQHVLAHAAVAVAAKAVTAAGRLLGGRSKGQHSVGTLCSNLVSA